MLRQYIPMKCVSLFSKALLVLLCSASLSWAVQATVTWTDNSSDETGFKVERRDGAVGNPWVPQATAAANVTSFNQAGLATNVQYCYRIIAFNAFGDAAPSPEACGTPATPLPASGVIVIFAP